MRDANLLGENALMPPQPGRFVKARKTVPSLEEDRVI